MACKIRKSITLWLHAPTHLNTLEKAVLIVCRRLVIVDEVNVLYELIVKELKTCTRWQIAFVMETLINLGMIHVLRNDKGETFYAMTMKGLYAKI